MSAAMLGLAAVLHTSALAFTALKWLGVLYLMFMAWQALRERGALAVDARLDGRLSQARDRHWIPDQHPQSETVDLLLAFLPQFVAANESHPLVRMLELSAAFMAMTFAVISRYCACSASIRPRSQS